MRLLLALPILVPLCGATAGLLAYRRGRLQRALSVGAAAALLLSGVLLFERVSRQGTQAMQIGGWPAPFGITLVADLLTAILVVLTGLQGLVTVVYSLADIDEARRSFGYYPLHQILLVGICGAFLTGDLFNLYVWFEVMLVASFVLMALGGERAQLRGAISYVILNQISSVLFLAGVGLLYGVTGTLNMADLSRRLAALPHTGLHTALAVLLLVAFGIKAAVFPLFFWLPASYHAPPVAVSAIFAGLLTKVGVYAQLRVFTLLFLRDADYTHGLLLLIAGLTMITGVLGAVAQGEFRRLLSFHIISQIGYLIMGLGLFTRPSLAAAIYFLLHISLAKAALFLVSGLVQRSCGSFTLKQLGGLYRRRPGLAALFLIPALSLAGIPPLSGFFAKLALVRAGLEAGRPLIVACALGVSLLTLFSMMKLWNEAFWKPAPETQADAPPAAPAKPAKSSKPAKPMGPAKIDEALLLGPTIAIVLLVAIAGLLAGPLFQVTGRAADQLLDPRGYIEAVLGSGAGR